MKYPFFIILLLLSPFLWIGCMLEEQPSPFYSLDYDCGTDLVHAFSVNGQQKIIVSTRINDSVQSILNSNFVNFEGDTLLEIQSFFRDGENRNVQLIIHFYLDPNLPAVCGDQVRGTASAFVRTFNNDGSSTVRSFLRHCDPPAYFRINYVDIENKEVCGEYSFTLSNSGNQLHFRNGYFDFFE